MGPGAKPSEADALETRFVHFYVLFVRKYVRRLVMTFENLQQNFDHCSSGEIYANITSKSGVNLV